MRKSIASRYASGPSSVSIALSPSAVLSTDPINLVNAFSRMGINDYGFDLTLFWSSNTSSENDRQSMSLILLYLLLSYIGGTEVVPGA